MTYIFGPEDDPDRCALTIREGVPTILLVRGRPKHLDPTALDILQTLVQSPGRRYDSDSLLELFRPTVPDLNASYFAKSYVKAIRKAIGDVRPFRVVRHQSEVGYYLAVKPARHADEEPASDDLSSLPSRSSLSSQSSLAPSDPIPAATVLPPSPGMQPDDIGSSHANVSTVSNAEISDALKQLLDGHAGTNDLRVLQRALLTGRLAYVRASGSASSAEPPVSGALVLTGRDISDDGRHSPSESSRSAIAMSNHQFEQFLHAALPAPAGCPPPWAHSTFLGRQNALSAVKTLLGIGASAALPSRQVIVSGLPGVGKSMLVAAVSRDPDVMRAFPDGVLWTSLDRTPALLSVLAGWGHVLGRHDLAWASTPRDAATALRLALTDKRILLIVDDVWDSGHAALFQELWNGRGGLLITTRLEGVANTLSTSGDDVHHLPVLGEEDALELLHVLAPVVVDAYPRVCRQLAQELEYLPLALQVAARLLRARHARHLPIESLVESIRDGSAIIAAQAPPDRAIDGRLPTVQALLHKSTDLLSERGRSGFMSLGAFAPKPATFTTAAMAHVWSAADPLPIVDELLDLGLLLPVEDRRFQMHALLVAHAVALRGTPDA
jgi:hypothetical protein